MKKAIFILISCVLASCSRDNINTLENEHVKLGFSAENGALISLYNVKEGVEHIDSAKAACGPLWEFEYMPEVPAVENLPEVVSFKKKSNDCLEIYWKQEEGLKGPELKATVRFKKDRPSLADWHIEATGLEGLGVKAIRFPLINGVKAAKHYNLD